MVRIGQFVNGQCLLYMHYFKHYTGRPTSLYATLVPVQSSLATVTKQNHSLTNAIYEEFLYIPTYF